MARTSPENKPSLVRNISELIFAVAVIALSAEVFVDLLDGDL